MKLFYKNKLDKLKSKNKGNTKLINEIEKLIIDLESYTWINQQDIIHARPDADCVHSKGFYFFNINVHRTLVLIEFDESGQAFIVWAGSLQD